MTRERQGLGIREFVNGIKNRILPKTDAKASVEPTIPQLIIVNPSAPSQEAKKIYFEPDEKNKNLIHSYLEETRERIKDFNSEGRLVAILWDPLFKSVPHDAIVEAVKPTGDDLDLTINALGPLLIGHFNGRIDHAIRTYEHMLEKRQKANNVDEQKKRTKTVIASDRNKDKDLNKKNVSNVKPRKIVLEGPNATKKFSDNLEDEALLRAIGKSGSEISEADILEILAKLQTETKIDLLLKHTEKVLTGPFKDYRVVKKGKLGRVLFQIDKNDRLHIRIAKHDDVYAAMRKVS